MLKRMLHLSDEGAKNMRIAILTCVVTNLTMFFPFVMILQVMQTMIDPIMNQQPLDTGKLWQLAAFGLLAAVVYIIAYSIEYDKTYTVAYGEATKVRTEVAERIRKLPLSFFNRKDLSELTTNIMGDCSNIEHITSHVVPQIFSNVITITLVTIMLAVYDWRMALAIFCVLPVSIGIIALSKKIQARFGERHVQAKLNVSDQVQEYLEGIKVVKAFGMSGEKSAALKNALNQMMKEAITFEAIAGTFVVLAQMILQSGMGIVILVGVNLLTNGSLSAIAFLTFAMISSRIYTPILSILTMLPELFYLLISTKRMQTLRVEPVMEGDTAVNLKDCAISFDDVTFAYNKNDVVKDMTFSIDGGVTALVGPSGSGKTTVSRLIARFWDVNKGKIAIDGRDIREIDPETLMRYMSFVFQDVVLFNDSVMNNIRIGKEGASDEEVYRAAKMAHCHEFIRNMADGYDTLLGENGNTLSGGERQRISIARALLKDAPIVLLDEATASLDPENEVLIQEAISELVKDKTVIVIAHRLKTIKGADQILVLNNGELTEQGQHEDLIEKDGLYAKLWNIQQDSLGWSVGSA